MPAAPARRRTLLLRAGAAVVVAAILAFSYVTLFHSGLNRLPERPCEGGVERDTAAAALPDARAAYERGVQHESGDDFKYFCYVKTSSGSIISGEAEVGRGTYETWPVRQSLKDTPAVEVAAPGVRALATENSAFVFVPCTPRNEKKHPKLPPLGLFVQARTVDDTRVEGAELRQLVTDFAYQLTKHTSKLADCQEPRIFPAQLPRLPMK